MKIPDKIVVDAKDFQKIKPGPKSIGVKRGNGTARKGVTGHVPGGKRVRYSDAEKMNAACAFAVTGNSRRVAELTGILEGTIRNWKTQEWWNEIQMRIVQEQDEELDVKLTKLVDKAVGEVNDRLENGDYVYNPKMDKLIRKPVNAKDLAIVTAITIDKRQLLRGQPTSRVEKVSQDERLLRLGEQFKQFTLAKEVVQELPEEEEVEEIIEIELPTDDIEEGEDFYTPFDEINGL